MVKLKEGESFRGILNTKQSHWGKGQTGIALCEDGTSEISDNKPIRAKEDGCPDGWIGDELDRKCYPTHRSFKCNYSGIYSYGYSGGDVWLYPHSSQNISNLRKSICSLNGKYGITKDNLVKENSSRKLLGKVGDFCN